MILPLAYLIIDVDYKPFAISIVSADDAWSDATDRAIFDNHIRWADVQTGISTNLFRDAMLHRGWKCIAVHLIKQ